MKKVLIIIPIIVVVLLILWLVVIGSNKSVRIAALEEELNTVSVERNTYMEESQDLQSKLDELQKQYDELKKENEELKAEPEPEAVEEIIISTPEVEVVEEAPAETAVEVPEEPAVEEEVVEEVVEEVLEEAVEEEVVEAASNLVYLGTFEMTAYEWTGNPCANGNYPTQGYTVACNSLPLGTQVYIDGYGYYVVEDRGASWHGDNWMDMYLGDVNACYQWGIKYLDVYLVE